MDQLDAAWPSLSCACTKDVRAARDEPILRTQEILLLSVSAKKPWVQAYYQGTGYKFILS